MSTVTTYGPRHLHLPNVPTVLLILLITALAVIAIELAVFGWRGSTTTAPPAPIPVHIAPDRTLPPMLEVSFG